MARAIEVIMLGTGGSIPTRERMTSCILVKDWRGLHILLDVGEGCQLRLQQAGVSPSSIDVIAVTHAHGDHVNGLAGLIQTMTLLDRSKELLIVGPKEVVAYAEESLELSRLKLGFPIRTLEAQGWSSIDISSQGGDVTRLKWAPSCHSIESYAFSIEWRLRARIDVDKIAERGLKPGPWLKDLLEKGESRIGDTVIHLEDVVSEPPSTITIAYSGDTAPCGSIVDLSRGADLLIHESTFTAESREEAHHAYHSTSVDAAEVAGEAGVRELILTHVSGRYRGYEARAMEREARRIFPNTRLAWDLMRVKIKV